MGRLIERGEVRWYHLVDGMPQDCCINLDHVQTVSKEKLGAFITTITPERLLRVREALLFALGFE